MGEHISKLVSIAGAALSHENPRNTDMEQYFTGSIGDEFLQLLCLKNGFFAFEQALQIYPSDTSYYPNLAEWNDQSGWRKEYRNLNNSICFFAQDIFGVQFCIVSNEVATFDPETAEIKRVAGTLEDWASLVLDDYNYLTGFSLAHDWQSANGQLKGGMRLLPKVPFVAGGAFDIANLYALDCEQGMKARANLASQIKDLPDGATIEFKIT